MPGFAEAVLLGLSSGPACLASCGPVLLPWLAFEAHNARGTAIALGEFLAGRLGGYLAFAALAWWAGMVLPLNPRAHAVFFGIAHLGIAAALVWHVFRPRRFCAGHRAGGPLTLGFLTGINLCAPFVAAAVRATESPGLGHAVLFFTAYFAGTTVWFLPALGVTGLRRFGSLATIARYMLSLLAAYYAYLGAVGIARSFVYV
jgi:hypothetical protein